MNTNGLGKFTGAAWVIGGLMAVSGPAMAQSVPDGKSFPSQAIRIIVPFTPGAINDTLARRIGQKLSENIKQPVVVENRPGGGATIGTDFVAKAPADGYTLLQVSSAHAVNPSLVKLPYDSTKSFDFITLAASAPLILLANASVPAKTLPELVALAKAKPGTLSYSSTGNGASAHLMGELLKSMAGIDVLHVPYKGAAQAMTDMVSGQVQFTFTSYTAAVSYIKSGRARPLAVTGTQRIAALPDVPTVAEAGYPGYDATAWWGYAAPAGTPPATLDTLNRELVKVLRDPALKAGFAEEGVQIVDSTPQEMSAYLQKEMALWGKVVKDGNIKAD